MAARNPYTGLAGCAICEIGHFTSVKLMKEHFESSAHSKKYINEEFRLGPDEFKRIYPSVPFNKLKELIAIHHRHAPKANNELGEFMFRCGIALDFKCDLCEVSTNHGSWLSHLKGIKHAVAYVKYLYKHSVNDFALEFPCLPGASKDQLATAQEKVYNETRAKNMPANAGFSVPEQSAAATGHQPSGPHHQQQQQQQQQQAQSTNNVYDRFYNEPKHGGQPKNRLSNAGQAGASRWNAKAPPSHAQGRQPSHGEESEWGPPKGNLRTPPPAAAAGSKSWEDPQSHRGDPYRRMQEGGGGSFSSKPSWQQQAHQMPTLDGDVKKGKADLVRQELANYNAKISHQESILMNRIDDQLELEARAGKQQQQLQMLLQQQKTTQEKEYEEKLRKQEEKQKEMEEQLATLKAQLQAQQQQQQMPMYAQQQQQQLWQQQQQANAGKSAELQQIIQQLQSTQQHYESNMQKVSEQRHRVEELTKIKFAQEQAARKREEEEAARKREHERGQKRKQDERDMRFHHPGPKRMPGQDWRPAADFESSRGNPNDRTYQGIPEGRHQDGPMGRPQEGPIGRPQDGHMGRHQDGPMGRHQDGPMDKPQDGPMGRPQDGPMGRNHDGPMGRYQDGPMGRHQDGPMGRHQDGPMGRPQDGPMRRPQDDQMRRLQGGPMVKPDGGPIRRHPQDGPTGRPHGGPMVRPPGGPMVRPPGGQMVRPPGGPMVRPQGGPMGRPQGGPMVQPQGGPMVRPQGGPMVRPQGGPMGRPQGGPMGRPQGGPMGRPQGGPEDEEYGPEDEDYGPEDEEYGPDDEDNWGEELSEERRNNIQQALAALHDTVKQYLTVLTAKHKDKAVEMMSEETCQQLAEMIAQLNEMNMEEGSNNDGQLLSILQSVSALDPNVVSGAAAELPGVDIGSMIAGLSSLQGEMYQMPPWRQGHPWPHHPHQQWKAKQNKKPFKKNYKSQQFANKKFMKNKFTKKKPFAAQAGSSNKKPYVNAKARSGAYMRKMVNVMKKGGNVSADLKKDVMNYKTKNGWVKVKQEKDK